MRFASFLLLLVLASASLRAQIVKVYQPIVGSAQFANFDRFTREPLLVVMEDEPSDAASQRRMAKDPKEAALFRADLAARNEALRAAVKFWTLTKVEFITSAQADAHYRDKEASHLLLRLGGLGPHGITVTSMVLSAEGKPEKLNFAGSLQVFANDVPEDARRRPVASASFAPHPNSYWSQTYFTSDAINAVQAMQRYVDARMHQQKDKDIEEAELQRIRQSSLALTQKTLLLDRARLDAELPAAQIAQLYPYPVQVVERAVIEAAVATADPRYLYARYLTVYRNHGYQLVDAASGQALAYAQFNLMRNIALGHIQDWTLKEFVRTAAGR
ncbi:hypothetical protein [Hymenobacter edaphi]|uniref:Uncharacterized protein n=1 Tax=Hymenobacter edaphi TaxID=2211146 RepID=A0A328BKD9_9BACT|nr:hypothetical protein [Hymenobacter edaphi]RAK67135.1 hypothetical protein DLM85_13140 [Hymenobacter edaphi]